MPQDQPNDADTKTDWAERRTDWAEDRTILANERTFAGWMRTGMTSIAIAVGLRAIFREADPTWLPKLVATIFIGVAIIIFWTARRNASKAQGRLKAHRAEMQPTRIFTIMAILFTLASLATGWVLWAL
ncbi:DUF202 domain-containing protein [uncultured Jannaschia sp.]|uniref:YidH family protein n=1 Tax=uncultured Jannaschia sp. TaxID=293347 RepID=UPI0026225A65|nr:DUF202 domain-containing protein [uncultured Jannaschia sp.]